MICVAGSLTPFVEARMKPRHGADWLHYASRAQGGSASAVLDECGLLKTMIVNRREVFDEAFGRNEKHRVRNFTSMALGRSVGRFRSWSHPFDLMNGALGK